MLNPQEDTPEKLWRARCSTAIYIRSISDLQLLSVLKGSLTARDDHLTGSDDDSSLCRASAYRWTAEAVLRQSSGYKFDYD